MCCPQRAGFALVAPRFEHSTTLLDNGKVLITAGNDGGTQRSAEIYDPATGTWSATGALDTSRRSHTATLLPDGRLLVAGGLNDINAVSSAKIYNPVTGVWAGTGARAAGALPFQKSEGFPLPFSTTTSIRVN